jgi:voltage-gated potassium channel
MEPSPTESPPAPSRRERLRVIIFEADTPAGKRFDVLLLIAIGLSVLVVMLESVAGIRADWARELRLVEWFFTILFTIEYGIRLYVSPRPIRYATSFFGIVDLLAILPTYLALLLTGGQYLATIRMLRLLRMFRVLKMVRYVGEGEVLLSALVASRAKIIVFFSGVLITMTILGTVIFLVEGPGNGFTSIPTSIYWAIVTITTVGYGDIVPLTPLGKSIAAIGMLVGYAIIAVPTGIVGAEITRALRAQRQDIEERQPCGGCGQVVHRRGANYCDRCGAEL